MKIILLLPLVVSVVSQVLLVQNICRVELFPTFNPFIGVVGSTYFYSCQGWNAEDGVAATWFINDIEYLSTDYPNIVIIDSDLVSILLLKNAAESLNNTLISCSATYSYNNMECYSASSLFQLQGNLSEVSLIKTNFNFNCSPNGLIFIDWSAPFTLDLTDVDVDIEYKLEVTADDHSTSIYADMIMNESYTGPLPNINSTSPSCNRYYISITPYNSYSDGQTTTVTVTPLDDVNVDIIVVNGSYTEDYQVNYALRSDPAICNIDVVYLYAKNYPDDAEISEYNINITNTCNMKSYISLTTFNSTVKLNRHYDTKYLLSNSDGTTTPNNTISTYDVQNATINEERKTLCLTFLKNSRAKGALLIMYPFYVHNETIVFLSLSQSNSEYDIQPYMIGTVLQVYDVEEDGYIMPGRIYPAIQAVMIPGTFVRYDASEANIKQCLNILMNTITVIHNCICEVLSATEGYQIILVYVQDQNRSVYANFSSCLRPLTFEVIDGLYHVAAFAFKNDTGIIDSSFHYSQSITVGINYTSVTTMPINYKSSVNIAGITGGIIGGLMIVSLIIILILFCIKWRHSHRERKQTIENSNKNVDLIESLEYSKEELSVSYTKFNDDDKNLSVSYSSHS